MVGPVAVAYNLQGVDKLVLNPEVTAKIFNGTIKTWDDPAIKAVKGNESLTLPAKPIQVVSRSDESGTTDNFQLYLKAAAPQAWTQGAGKQFKGGVGNGAEKSNGVVEAAKAADGAITYVEAAFAKDGVKPALIDSGAGAVELTAENVAKTLDAAKFKTEGTNDLALDLDAIYSSKVAGTYPLLLVTYEIVCSKYADPEVAKAVRAYLNVAATDGQQPLAEKGYVSHPAEPPGEGAGRGQGDRLTDPDAGTLRSECVDERPTFGRTPRRRRDNRRRGRGGSAPDNAGAVITSTSRDAAATRRHPVESDRGPAR